MCFRKVVAYIHGIIGALSALINAILGGHYFQTCSTANFQRKLDGKSHICDLLDIVSGNPEHCYQSWLFYQHRTRSTISYLEYEDNFLEEEKTRFEEANGSPRRFTEKLGLYRNKISIPQK